MSFDAVNRSHIEQSKQEITVAKGIVTVFRGLSREEKREAVILLAVTFVNALLSLLGLASILPFFQLLVMPSPLEPGTLVADVFRNFGVTSEFIAIVLTGTMVVVLIVAKNLFGILHYHMVGQFTAKVESRLATQLLTRIVDAPFSWYIQQNTSILRDTVMTHVFELARGVIRPALSLANNALILSSALILLVPMTPIPALVVGVITIIIATVLLRLARSRIARASTLKRDMNLMAGVAATEAVAGGRDVRMSEAGSLLKTEFHQSYERYTQADAASRQWQIVPRAGIEIIGLGALVTVTIVALSLGLERLEVASILALYAVVAVRLIPVIGETANALSAIQISLPAVAAMENLKSELPPPMETSGSTLPADWKLLKLDNVSFDYVSSSRGAIRGVSLEITRGCSYGIVGTSGAGKSTLVDIIAGLLSPNSGQVSIDGTWQVDASNASQWRKRIAYVAQSPLIFDMSIADNITLGKGNDVSGERLARAVSGAGLNEVVEALDQKVHTPIGDRGTRLSGGQRQRVAIARAIYQDADLLILDEATSALDSLTEQEIGREIDALKGRVTLIAIAHRLSTVIGCDEIILLDEGRVLARGPHAELMATSREYLAFVRAQTMPSN